MGLLPLITVLVWEAESDIDDFVYREPSRGWGRKEGCHPMLLYSEANGIVVSWAQVGPTGKGGRGYR